MNLILLSKPRKAAARLPRLRLPGSPWLFVYTWFVMRTSLASGFFIAIGCALLVSEALMRKGGLTEGAGPLIGLYPCAVGAGGLAFSVLVLLLLAAWSYLDTDRP